MHYARWKRGQNLEAPSRYMGIAPRTGHKKRRVLSEIQERFWAKVDKTESCWLWTAGKVKGYGEFDGAYAHRLSYEWLVGPIPTGMVIDHICHVSACVNPEHLRCVTHKQNLEHRLGAQQNNNSSGIRGVTWCKDKQKWRAQAQHNGRTNYGGYFKDLTDAEAAAIKLRNRLFTCNDADR